MLMLTWMFVFQVPFVIAEKAVLGSKMVTSNKGTATAVLVVVAAAAVAYFTQSYSA